MTSVQVELQLTEDPELDIALVDDALKLAGTSESVIVVLFGSRQAAARVKEEWLRAGRSGDAIVLAGPRMLADGDRVVLHSLLLVALARAVEKTRFFRLDEKSGCVEYQVEAWIHQVGSCVSSIKSAAGAAVDGDERRLGGVADVLRDVIENAGRDGIRAAARTELSALRKVCELESGFLAVIDYRDRKRVAKTGFVEGIARNPIFSVELALANGRVGEAWRDAWLNRMDFVTIGGGLAARALKGDENAIMNLLVWWSAYCFWRGVKIGNLGSYSEAVIMSVRALEMFLQSHLLFSGKAILQEDRGLRVGNRNISGVGGLINNMPRELEGALGLEGLESIREVVSIRNTSLLGHGTSYASPAHARHCADSLRDAIRSMDAASGGSWRSLVRKCELLEVDKMQENFARGVLGRCTQRIM